MFACNGSLRLKPNTLSEFTRIFDKEVIPMLRKQSGFRDEITFASSTNKTGKFDFLNVADGDYLIKFSCIGFHEVIKSGIKIGNVGRKLNSGKTELVSSITDLDEVVVTSKKETFNNSVDRKVYNVEQDIMSKSGTAGDLLQNIPSVSVDIDGNVSLRGSQNVMIMINGKTSPLMDKSSATVLDEMPANSIERIEVITNPSASFKPDGTSGIINIVLKKNTGTRSEQRRV